MSDLKNELNNLGDNIVKDAKANVPVDTGALRKSIQYKTKIQSEEFFGVFVSELHYGKYVNDGTKNQKAQPFLTDAIEKNLPKGIEEITKTITNGVLTQVLNKGK